MSLFSLKGRVALVTGGGRGIGRGIAEGLAAEGARIVCASRTRRQLDETVAAIVEAGGEAAAIELDMADLASVEKAAAAGIAEFGQIDILVNNAGWDKLEPFLRSEEETWDKIIAINFKAALYTLKTVLPHMVERGGGTVVNIASDAGRVGSMGEAVYSGTKGALIAFSKTLAREHARHGIRVNVVCPGLTETPLLQSIRDQSPKTEKVIDAVTRAIPLGRVGNPEDIAGAVVYLASPEANYVTGQTLSVSGGLTMC